MSYMDYMKNQLYCIITHVISMVGCCIFLNMLNISKGIVEILLLVWIIILGIYINIRYYFRYRYFREILSQFNGIDKKYLIAEVMEPPKNPSDRFFYQILKACNKSMIEQISISKRERKEYKEYIEQWIHDVKTPIAAMQLVCENNKSDVTRKLLIELEKISHFTEQALYYARSENVEKDYLIKEVVLSDIVHNAIAENKQLLIQNHINLDIKDCECTVYTDEKWISFILNQLIANAVKYRKKDPLLIFHSRIEVGKVIFSIHDNGIGISESDLPRIFDKGFTGENGRVNKYSTGIGLYLCKRLCDKLGIYITVNSEREIGTTVELIFPKGDFIKTL